MSKNFVFALSFFLGTKLFAYNCPVTMPATDNIPAPFQATPLPTVNKGDPLIQVKDQIFSLPQLQGRILCVYTSSIYGTPETGLLTDSFSYAPDVKSDWNESKDIFIVYSCDPAKAPCSFRSLSLPFHH